MGTMRPNDAARREKDFLIERISRSMAALFGDISLSRVKNGVHE
jgi:hypothetical protein